MKHDLKIFGLSYWRDEMGKTTGEGKGGCSCLECVKFGNSIKHHVETPSYFCKPGKNVSVLSRFGIAYLPSESK